MAALTVDEQSMVEEFRSDTAWRSKLAKKLNCSAPTVSGVIGELKKIMSRGIYLFVLLAPPTRAVVAPAEMSELLRLIHDVNDELTRLEQELLHEAGDLLRRRDAEFAVETATLSEIHVEDIHLAEASYAVHVPHQSIHAPTFLCVARCARHLTTKALR